MTNTEVSKNPKLFEVEEVNGNVTAAELRIICTTAINIHARRMFEFGTFDGRTTLNLALNTPVDARVYTLDIPESALSTLKYPLASSGRNHDLKYILKPEIGARYKKYPDAAAKIIQLVGDSATFDYSAYKNSMDLIFVDGSHAGDYVKNDTEEAFSMIKRGGVILWHDYGNWPDVTAYLNRSAKEDSRFAGLKHIEGTTLATLVIPI